MKSAVVLLALAASAQAGGMRGSAAPPAPGAKPVVGAAAVATEQPLNSPGAMIMHHEATTKLANSIPMSYGAGAKPGSYVPSWAGAQMNANVKAIKDSWESQEGRLGYYNGHFGYGPSVHPDLHQAYQWNPFQSPYGKQGVATPGMPGLPATSAYKGAAPAGMPKETLAEMEKLNAAAPANLKAPLTPVTLPNGMRMNVPNGDLNALGLPTAPGVPVDANKLLGSPVTLPGTPEHYKDVTSRIINEQATVGAQMQQVQQVESQHAQRAAYLGAMMHQLQTQYLQAQHLDHLQKEYMEKMARRNAALGIDRHRVSNEYTLGAMLQQYNHIKQYETHVRNVVTQIDTVKNNLMKEIMSYRQAIRKDTNAIKQLLDGKIPSASGPSGPAPTKEEEKLEKQEAAALKLSEKAAEKQKSADEAAVKANGDFIDHVESALNKGPEDISGPSGASGPVRL